MSPFIERLGWVLIHSLWQLALLAAAAFVVQRAMQRTSAAARYAALLALLGLVVAAPLITWSVLPTPAVLPVAELPAPAPALAPVPTPKLEPPAPVLAPAPVTVGATAPITPAAPAPLEPTIPVKAPEPLQPTWSQWAQQSIKPWLSTIVWGWSLGVLAFAIRPLWSWFTVRQLRTQGVSPVSESVQAALAETARRLGISQAVRVLQSTIVQVPVVAGYLKPVILLPASIVTGLPASQLEAILAHELAHIRRHDYLANLIQTLVETVFFYHPAVWWLSHQIRCERENCCDDIAVAMLGNRLDYSRALLAVEELRGTPTTLAVGASGGSLLGRVRRLFHRDVEQLRLSNGSITLCGLIGVGLIALATVASTNHGRSGELFVPGAKAEIDGFGTIEVLGLRFVDSEWWSPDGLNLSASVDLGDPMRHLFNDDPMNGRQIGIVARFSGVDSPRQSRVRLDTIRTGGSGSWSSQGRRRVEQYQVTDIRFCSTNLSPDAITGELTVLLSFDAWSPWYTIDLKSPEASQNEGPLAPLVGRTPSSLASTKCEIGLQFKSGVHEEIYYDQIALDAAGNEIPSIGKAGNHTLGLMIYSVPESQVAKLRYRLQRFTHEVRFRDISLKAGHQTEPQTRVQVLHRPVRPTAFTEPATSLASWPQLGGSSAHNPISPVTNLPTQFHLDRQENIRWSQPIGDFAFSSPVVAEGKVLIGTNNAIGRDPRFPASIDRACLQCFDERTGEFLWQYSSPKMEQGRRHDWPSIGICSTPVIEGDRVWFATNRCEIVCLDLNGFRDRANDEVGVEQPMTRFLDEAALTNPDVVWKYDMFNKLGVRPLNATCVTPVIAGDLLLLNSGNDVDESYMNVPAPEAPAFLAFHKTTGQLIWSDKTPNPNILGNGCSMGAPAVAKIDGVWQAIFAGYDGWLHAFDLESIQRGETLLLWKFDLNPKESQYRLSGPRNEFTYRGLPATPVVVGNHVFAAVGHNPERGEGLGRLWCIDATKRGDLSSDLVYNKAAPDVVIPHKRVQACEPDKGDFTRPNPNSGVEWVYTTDDLNKNGQIEYEEQMHLSNSLPAIHGGLLLTTDLSGLVHCLDVTTGELLWTHDQLATCWSGPLLADGKAWVIDEDGDLSIFALSREKQLIAEIAMNSPGYTNFAAANQTLYLATKTQLVAIGSGAFPKPDGVTAKLPGGLEIELVGVTPNAAPTSEGWRVDGAPLESIGDWQPGTTISKDGDRVSISTGNYSKDKTPHPLARDLLFESRGLRSHPAWVILNQKGLTQFENVNSDETIRRRLSYLPKESGQPLTVEMALTDSPWGPWQQIDKSGKRINTITTFEPDQKLYEEIKFLRFGPALEGNTQRPLELVLEEPATHDDYLSGVFDITVRFIGTDQKVWTTYAQPKPRQNGRRQVVWRTGGDVPLEKIDHVEFRLRPYRHFITFKNVPLNRTPGAQVTVEHRSLPLPPTLASDPRFTAQVPGGVEIELLRIVRNDLPEDQSWTPDGKPSPGRLDWPQRSHFKVQPDGNGFSSSHEGPGSDRAWDLVYEVRGSGVKPFASVELIVDGSVSSSQFSPAIGPRLVTVLPNAPESLTLFQMRVGTEPWGQWIQVGADGKVLNPEAINKKSNSPYPLIWITGAGIDEDNPDRSWFKWMALPHANQLYRMEVRAIDDDGQSHQFKSVTHKVTAATMHEITQWFDLPVEKLNRFEYRMRPYRHLVTYDNICTDPKKPTEVRVSVEPIVYPNEAAVEKSRLLVLNPDNTPWQGSLVAGHIGFIPPDAQAWNTGVGKDGQADLSALPAGKHWLISRFPWSVIPIETPLQQSLRQPLRLGTPPKKHSSSNYSGNLSVQRDEQGREFIQCDVYNNTDELWSFSELDLELEAGWFSTESHGHSPQWLGGTLTEVPQIEIPPGQKGSLRIDWSEWAKRGVWDPMSGPQNVSKPVLPDQEPGKIWVRISGPGFGTNPVAVMHPDKLLAVSDAPDPQAVAALDKPLYLHWLAPAIQSSTDTRVHKPHLLATQQITPGQPFDLFITYGSDTNHRRIEGMVQHLNGKYVGRFDAAYRTSVYRFRGELTFDTLYDGENLAFSSAVHPTYCVLSTQREAETFLASLADPKRQTQLPKPIEGFDWEADPAAGIKPLSLHLFSEKLDGQKTNHILTTRVASGAPIDILVQGLSPLIRGKLEARGDSLFADLFAQPFNGGSYQGAYETEKPFGPKVFVISGNMLVPFAFVVSENADPEPWKDLRPLEINAELKELQPQVPLPQLPEAAVGAFRVPAQIRQQALKLATAYRAGRGTVASRRPAGLEDLSTPQAIQAAVETAWRDVKSEKRWEALTRLRYLGEHVPFEQLVEGTKSDDPEVVRWCLQPLASTGERGLPALLHSLKSRDVGIRMAAAQSLGRSDQPQAVLPLIEALKEETDGVVQASLIRALMSLRSHEPSRKLVQIQMATPFGDYLREQFRPLEPPPGVAALRVTAADWRLCRNALSVLGELYTPVQLDRLVELLGSHDVFVKSAATHAVAHLEHIPSVPALIRTKGYPSEIGLAKIATPEAIAELLARLDSSDQAVRLSVLKALSEYADRWAAPLLIALLDDPSLRVSARQDHNPEIPNTVVFRESPETHRAHGSLQLFLRRFGMPWDQDAAMMFLGSPVLPEKSAPHNVKEEIESLKTWWAKHGADFLAGKDVAFPKLTSAPGFYSAGIPDTQQIQAGPVQPADEPIPQPPMPEEPNPLRIDLIGLTYDSVPKKDTWNPNGQPLPAPDWVQQLPKLYGNDKSQPAPLYLFEVHGLRAKPSFRHRYQPAVVSGDDEVPEGRPYRMAVLLEDLNPERSKSIVSGDHPSMRVSDEPWGPWRTVLRAGLAPPHRGDDTYRAGYERISFRGIHYESKSPYPNRQLITVVTQKQPQEFESQYAVEVEAVLSDGTHQPITPIPQNRAEESPAEARSQTVYWPFDPAKTDHLRYRIRPYRHQFVFANVNYAPSQNPSNYTPFKTVYTKLEHDLPKPEAAIQQPEPQDRPRLHAKGEAEARAELERLAITDPGHIHATRRATANPNGWKWSVYLPPGKTWRLYCDSGMIPKWQDIQPTAETTSYPIHRKDEQRIIELEAYVSPDTSDDGKLKLWVEADRSFLQGLDWVTWRIAPEVADYITGRTQKSGTINLDLDIGGVNTLNAGRNRFRRVLTHRRFREANDKENVEPEIMPGFCVWIQADPEVPKEPTVGQANPKAQIALVQNLSSHDQSIRDRAAAQLKSEFKPSAKEPWQAKVDSIPKNAPRAEVIAKLGIDEKRDLYGAEDTMEQYRLDDTWMVRIWFTGDLQKLNTIELVEQLHRPWVDPPASFTGTWVTYYVNGTKAHEIEYLNGKYHGRHRSYHSNGRLLVQQHYVDHVAHGEDTGYDASGNLSYRGLYENGKQVGPWIHYNEDGSERSRTEHPAPRKGEVSPPEPANPVAAPSVELQVVDAETGQPIAGAEVTVRQAISSWQPKRPDAATAKLNISIAVPESLSTLRASETGHFSFTTPPELRDWLSDLQLSIQHPDYVIEQSFGAFQVTPEMAADLSLLTKKVFPGGLIKLKRGHEISGQVLGPDGQPAAGVKLYAAWQMPQYLDMPPHAVTDAQGRYKFRTVKETESDLIFVIPKDAVAVSFPLKSKYGEHPTIQLERGTIITGQVLGQDGKPLAGVVVQANGSDSVYDGFPKPLARVLTDAEGRYRLPPQKLPVDVRVSTLGWMGGWQPPGRSLMIDEVLMPVMVRDESQTVKTPGADASGSQSRTLDFRPCETVTLTAHVFDEKGQPATDCELAVYGTAPDSLRDDDKLRSTWRGRFHAVADQPGLFRVKAPKGLVNATLVDPEIPTGPRQKWTRATSLEESIPGPRTEAGWGVLWNDDESIIVGEPAKTALIHSTTDTSGPEPDPARDSGEWGTAIEGLRSRLRLIRDPSQPPAAPWKVGQLVFVALEIENVSEAEKQLSVSSIFSLDDVQITGPDGKPCPDVRGPLSVLERQITIPPGETKAVIERADLTEQFLMTEPGEYRIRANSPTVSKELSSGELRITLVEGEVSPIREVYRDVQSKAPAGSLLVLVQDQLWVFVSGQTKSTDLQGNPVVKIWHRIESVPAAELPQGAVELKVPNGSEHWYAEIPAGATQQWKTVEQDLLNVCQGVTTTTAKLSPQTYSGEDTSQTEPLLIPELGLWGVPVSADEVLALGVTRTPPVPGGVRITAIEPGGYIDSQIKAGKLKFPVGEVIHNVAARDVTSAKDVSRNIVATRREGHSGFFIGTASATGKGRFSVDFSELLTDPQTGQLKLPPLAFHVVAANAIKEPVDESEHTWFLIGGDFSSKRFENVHKNWDHLTLPVEKTVGDKRLGLVGDSAATSIPWDGSWHVEKCELSEDPRNPNQFLVDVTVDSQGAELLRRLTTDHHRERLAIVVEEQIVLAPTILSVIESQFSITGKFTKAEGEQLVQAIRRGMLNNEFQRVPPVSSAKESSSNVESPDQSRPLVERLNSVIETSEKRARQSIVTPYMAIKFMLAFGPDATFNDPETTSPTPIRVEDWLCGGPKHRRISVWQVTPHGVQTQPYRNLKDLYVFEGAYGSFLNAMAESGLPLTHSLKASSSDGEIEDHTIQDVLMHYQRTMPNRTEDFRFTEALLRYGQLQATWKDAYGKDRSTLDLVRSTLRAKPSDSINVESMRLTVLAIARNQHQHQHQQDKGSVGDSELRTEIEKHLLDAISNARRAQLPEGSWPPSKYSELSATSQMLKWIVEATPPAQLGDDWIFRAVESLITRITDRKSPVTSPHEFLDTIHALRVYRDRRFRAPMKAELP